MESSIWELEKRAEIHMNKNNRTIMNVLSKIHLAKLPVNAKYQLNDVFSSTNEGVILIHSVLPKN
ncbi:MAG TPA: hypothetical protein VFY68_11910 [Nitrososphaeraceae archaeon]|nr:hypothetical protein [Nitrososphaeraceae archaeon]